MGLTPNTVPRERDGRERCPKMFITKNLLETLEPRCVEMIQRETKRIAKRKWYPTGSQGRYFESTCHHPEVRLVVGALFTAQTRCSRRRETGSIFVFWNSFYNDSMGSIFRKSVTKIVIEREGEGERESDHLSLITKHQPTFSLRTTRVRTPGPKRERERSEHMWWQVCHIS